MTDTEKIEGLKALCEKMRPKTTNYTKTDIENIVKDMTFNDVVDDFLLQAKFINETLQILNG